MALRLSGKTIASRRDCVILPGLYLYAVVREGDLIVGPDGSTGDEIKARKINSFSSVT